MARLNAKPVRHLVIVLGDQLNRESAAFDGFDQEADGVWMVEVREEAEHVWMTKPHIAIFLSAMRHFRDELRADDLEVDYREMDDPDNCGDLGCELLGAIEVRQPSKVIAVKPGEWRVEQLLIDAMERRGMALEIRPDQHFLSSLDAFEEHVEGRRQLLLERFYREMRRDSGILMDGNEPAGDRWNYDAENRRSFGVEGPGDVPSPIAFPPDAVTREVLDLVEHHFADHPGSLSHFDWPVTSEQAEEALGDFVEHRLPNFGSYQDAMWMEEPYLYHSRLSAALNLKLFDPRDAIDAAVRAYTRSGAPLNSVEGFVRQILGWREYVRGVYWHYMPEYAELNALDADAPLPDFYWTADTEMMCLRECIQQTLDHGYAHHIQRLMVTGLFALLLGVEPRRVHEWYLAVYVDAVEWVELPNTLGMSQFADGGIMATKPYCASGSYIQRMSNYCEHCRYDPSERLGEDACPFTTLYWDFLMRHEEQLEENPRMGLQLYNLRRIESDERRAIRRHATALRDRVTAGESLRHDPD